MNVVLSRSWMRRAAVAPAALALGALAACGGGASDASSGDDEVASLEDGTSSGGDAAADAADPANPADAGDTNLTADEAALEFSQCLRDEGLDIPDIGVDSNGNIALRDAFAQIDPSDQAFQDAMDACSDRLAGAGFGGGPGLGRNSTEFQDALVEMTDCVRDAGFDVGDLTAPGGGAGAGAGQGQGGGQGAGRGQGDASFGDRAARLAGRLGLDIEDPAVIEAMETCRPILENALAGDAGTG